MREVCIALNIYKHDKCNCQDMSQFIALKPCKEHINKYYTGGPRYMREIGTAKIGI